jgi:hypothetical protein
MGSATILASKDFLVLAASMALAMRTIWIGVMKGDPVVTLSTRHSAVMARQNLSLQKAMSGCSAAALHIMRSIHVAEMLQGRSPPPQLDQLLQPQQPRGRAFQSGTLAVTVA